MKLKSRQFRLARLCDADAIARMSRDMIEQGLPWRWRGSRIRQAIKDPDTNCVISMNLSQLTGFSITTFGENKAHLALLAVHPEFRRKGIGDYLVRWQELVAQTAGIQKITLEVRANNSAAIAFYNSLGYVDSGIIPSYYDNSENALRMVHLI